MTELNKAPHARIFKSMIVITDGHALLNGNREINIPKSQMENFPDGYYIGTQESSEKGDKNRDYLLVSVVDDEAGADFVAAFNCAYRNMARQREMYEELNSINPFKASKIPNISKYLEADPSLTEEEIKVCRRSLMNQWKNIKLEDIKPSQQVSIFCEDGEWRALIKC